jgi:hypothetical protein
MSHTPKTVRQKILRYPLKKWPSRVREVYFEWVKETYGDVAQPESYVEGYRAWKQVVWATEEPIYRQPTHLITSQKIINEALAIMNNTFKETYETHEYNQP